MDTENVAALARYDAEIASIEAQLRAGSSDVDGLTLALYDWANERRLIQCEGLGQNR